MYIFWPAVWFFLISVVVIVVWTARGIRRDRKEEWRHISLITDAYVRSLKSKDEDHG